MQLGNSLVLLFFLNERVCPDLCGSGGWVSFPKAKGRWFDSQSGHMPWVVGSQEVTSQCYFPTLMFLSHSFSLHSPFSDDR